MKNLLEKRIQELMAIAEKSVAEYNALMGRLQESKDLLAAWYKEQCEKENHDSEVVSDKEASDAAH